MTNEEMAQLYRSGLSINQIAKLCNRYYSYVATRLHKEKVQMRSVSDGVHLARCSPQIEMNNEIQELLDGLLLGDGSVANDGRFMIGQSWDHREWIYNLEQELNSLGIETNITYKNAATTMIRGKLYNQQPTIYLRSMRYSCFKDQRERWYPDGKKIIPSDVILTARSLSNWCCGDGYCGGKGYHLTFCTDGFSDSDRQLLISRLYELYGWKLVLIPSRGRISITKNQDRYEFKTLVEQYMPETFKYKLKLKINTRKLKENIEEERQRKLRQRRENYHNKSKAPAINLSV